MLFLKRIYTVTLLGVWFYSGLCHGRLCRNTEINRMPIKFDVKYRQVIEGTLDDIKLILIVNWTATGVDYSEFDGFLVSLAASGVPLPPTADCQASNSHLWIKTPNVSECGSRSESTPNCSVATTPDHPDYCPCNVKTCPALAGVTCTGATRMMESKKLGGYFSVPNTRHSVRYQIEFNKQYMLTLRPYYRQYTTFSAKKETISPNWHCADAVSTAHSLSIPDASVKCCALGDNSFLPMDFRRGELILDKTTDTLNLTISWVPPKPNKLLIDVFMHARLIGGSMMETEYVPRMTEHITKGAIESNRTCARDNRRQFSTIHNMLPNSEYLIVIAAGYGGEYQAMCSHGKCGFNKRITTEFDPCDKQRSRCNIGWKCVALHVDGEVTVPDTSCVPGKTDNDSIVSSTSQNTVLDSGNDATHFADPHEIATTKGYVIASGEVSSNQSGTGKAKSNDPSQKLHSELPTGADLCESIPPYCDEHAVCDLDKHTSKRSCSCTAGMVGDGVTKSYNGSGCSGCPMVNECDIMAVCVAHETSSETYICQCDEHYYGDGMISGSGCTSHAKRTAIIAVPVVLLGLILFAIVLWCICSARRVKHRRIRNDISL